MLFTMFVAAVLVSITVLIHAAGFNLMLRLLRNLLAAVPTQPWPVLWLLIRVTWLLVLIHVAEIIVWALFYLSEGWLPDLESAFYFSAATYTTLGYGDLLLAAPWRMLGPIEALAGILMTGLSAALFFVLATRIVMARMDAKQK